MLTPHDVIVVVHRVGGADGVSVTITHKRSGLQVWSDGPEEQALIDFLLVELYRRVKREWRARAKDRRAGPAAGDLV